MLDREGLNRAFTIYATYLSHIWVRKILAHICKCSRLLYLGMLPHFGKDHLYTHLCLKVEIDIIEQNHEHFLETSSDDSETGQSNQVSIFLKILYQFCNSS